MHSKTSGTKGTFAETRDHAMEIMVSGQAKQTAVTFCVTFILQGFIVLLF